MANSRLLQRLVRKRIYEYAEQHPELTWSEITPRERSEISRSVNEELKEAGIVPVTQELLDYQMAMNLMTWKIKTNRKAFALEEAADKQDGTKSTERQEQRTKRKRGRPRTVEW